MCPYWCREGADEFAEDHQISAEDHQISAEDHQITAEPEDNKTVAREAFAQEPTHGGLLVDALLTQEDPAAVDGETCMAFEAGRLCFGKSRRHTFLQGTHFG